MTATRDVDQISELHTHVAQLKQEKNILQIHNNFTLHKKINKGRLFKLAIT